MKEKRKLEKERVKHKRRKRKIRKRKRREGTTHHVSNQTKNSEYSETGKLANGNRLIHRLFL